MRTDFGTSIFNFHVPGDKSKKAALFRMLSTLANDDEYPSKSWVVMKLTRPTIGRKDGPGKIKEKNLKTKKNSAVLSILWPARFSGIKKEEQ